jgi:ADP-ribosylglycohydrolase
MIEFMEFVENFTFMTHRSVVALASCWAHYLGVRYLLSSKEEGFFSEEFLAHASRGILGAWALKVANGHVDLETDQLREGLQAIVYRQAESRPPLLSPVGPEAFSVKVTMPLAYEHFVSNPHSIESLYSVIAAGGDTDSTGAIVGGLLGALNGPEVFPKHLVYGLRNKTAVLKIANEFCDAVGIE